MINCKALVHKKIITEHLVQKVCCSFQFASCCFALKRKQFGFQLRSWLSDNKILNEQPSSKVSLLLKLPSHTTSDERVPGL